MASFCPDARPCGNCPTFVWPLVVAPAAAAEAVVSPQLGGAPAAMYMMAPMPINFNGDGGLAYSISIPSATTDYNIDFHFGLGPPLQSNFETFGHAVEHYSQPGNAVEHSDGSGIVPTNFDIMQAPVQCNSMPSQVELQRASSDESSFTNQPSQQRYCSGLTSWADASDDEEEDFYPVDENADQRFHYDSPSEQLVSASSCYGMSKSTLRRRRRQRAAARGSAALDQGGCISQGEEGPKSTEAQADELLTLFRSGGESARVAAARFRRLAFTNQASCRVAQSVLEKGKKEEAAELSKALRGHVREAMRSLFANYVVQKIVEVLPSESTSFITEELVGCAKEMVRNRCGCRIFCRLLEHGPLTDTYTSALLTEVLQDADALCKHAYGNYVIRHLLEYGFLEHQQWIVMALCQDLLENAKHQHGSRVVETALQFCDAQEQQTLIEGLLADPNQFLSLAKSLSGRHVAKALLKTPGQNRTAEMIWGWQRELQSSKYGRLVLEALQEIN
jgi:hypothetical protein